jgi:endonuclease YncB( thermonuclease family)
MDDIGLGIRLVNITMIADLNNNTAELRLLFYQSYCLYRYGVYIGDIFVDKTNLNLKLVEMGVATPYFYKGERGKYSSALFIAAQTAKKNNIGLWKACPNTKLDPYKPVNSGVIR